MSESDWEWDVERKWGRNKPKCRPKESKSILIICLIVNEAKNVFNVQVEATKNLWNVGKTGRNEQMNNIYSERQEEKRKTEETIYYFRLSGFMFLVRPNFILTSHWHRIVFLKVYLNHPKMVNYLMFVELEWKQTIPKWDIFHLLHWFWCLIKESTLYSFGCDGIEYEAGDS